MSCLYMPCAGGNQKSGYKYVDSPWTRQVFCAPSPYPIRFSIELRLSRAYDQIRVMNGLLYLTLFLFHSYFFCSTHSSISKLLCFLFFMRELAAPSPYFQMSILNPRTQLTFHLNFFGSGWKRQRKYHRQFRAWNDGSLGSKRQVPHQSEQE